MLLKQTYEVTLPEPAGLGSCSLHEPTHVRVLVARECVLPIFGFPDQTTALDHQADEKDISVAAHVDYVTISSSLVRSSSALRPFGYRIFQEETSTFHLCFAGFIGRVVAKKPKNVRPFIWQRSLSPSTHPARLFTHKLRCPKSISHSASVTLDQRATGPPCGASPPPARAARAATPASPSPTSRALVLLGPFAQLLFRPRSHRRCISRPVRLGRLESQTGARRFPSPCKKQRGAASPPPPS